LLDKWKAGKVLLLDRQASTSNKVKKACWKGSLPFALRVRVTAGRMEVL
jgi:hypothetical protein